MTRLKRKKELGDGKNTGNDVRFGTPELVANYRAKRLKKIVPDTIIELGAGAGFASNAFAKAAKRVIAIDIDAERLARAELAENVIAIPGDALDPAIVKKIATLCNGETVLFLDPERPPSSDHRTLTEIRPDIREVIATYSKITPNIAIELPPHLDAHELDSLPAHEREYLSIDGVLNRLTLYFGGLATCTISVVQLPSDHRLEAQTVEPVRELRVEEHYILEPDAALVRAGLIGNALAGLPVIIESSRTAAGTAKEFYVAAKRTTSPFFRRRRILAHGDRRTIEKRLFRYRNVVLHGALSQGQQRELIFSLRPFCKGKKDTAPAHLYIAKRWYLTE